MPPGFKAAQAEEEDDSMPGLEPTPQASTSAPKPSTPAPKEKAPEPEPAAADPDAEAKATANEAKAAGNASYKARKFEEAVGHYERAWTAYPKDITFLTNLAGEYLIRSTDNSRLL